MIDLLRPLGLALLAFLAGLLPSLRFSPDPLPLVALAGISAVWVSGACRVRLHERRADLAVLAAYLLAGAASGAAGAALARDDCRAWIPEGATLTAEGVLGAGTAPPGAGGSSRAPLLPLEGARLAGAGGRCRGAVRVRLDPETAAMPAGTRVRLTGEWVPGAHPVLASGWPRDPYYAGFLAVDRVVGRERPSLLRDPLLVLRGRTESTLRRLFPAHSPLTEALLLGRRERLDPAVSDRFARSGLIHLLAISGTHVALLAGILLVVGGAVRLPRRRTVLLCILLIAGYLAMIGAPASAVRAGIMLSLALLAVLLQRPAAAVPMMAAAALAILAWSPMAVVDVGFQLSFAGVVGILVARRLVLRSVSARALRRPLLRPALESVTISAAAFAATAPIVAHHFGQIAPVAVLANLPAAPATGLALSGAVAALALHPVAPPLASVVADGASVALGALDLIASVAADLPFGHMAVSRPDWLSWLAAVLAAALAWHLTSYLRTRTRWVVAAGATTALMIAWPGLARSAPGLLEIHFLDVGQGDAIAVRTPRDRWILIDAGPRGVTYDAGERRVVPFLHAHRVRRLEALILTHPDADHIGGAPAVLRALEVGAVVEPGLPVGKELYAEVLSALESRAVPWRAARAGDTLRLDGVELMFLWPEAAFLDPAAEANEISAVVLLRFGEFEALLTGDAPAEVELRLVRRHRAGLRAEVLKAGHHGSWTSTSAELLGAVDPELVVIPVGRRNRYGHPAPEVLRRIRGTGIDIARTDRDGTITLRVAGGAGGDWVRVEP